MLFICVTACSSSLFILITLQYSVSWICLSILVLMDIWVAFNLLSKNSAILNSVAFGYHISAEYVYTLKNGICGLYSVHIVSGCSMFWLAPSIARLFQFSHSVGMYIIALGIYCISLLIHEIEHLCIYYGKFGDSFMWSACLSVFFHFSIECPFLSWIFRFVLEILVICYLTLQIALFLCVVLRV